MDTELDNNCQTYTKVRQWKSCFLISLCETSISCLWIHEKTSSNFWRILQNFDMVKMKHKRFGASYYQIDRQNRQTILYAPPYKHTTLRTKYLLSGAKKVLLHWIGEKRVHFWDLSMTGSYLAKSYVWFHVVWLSWLDQTSFIVKFKHIPIWHLGKR